VTFGDDKKGQVLGTCVIKVNDFFTLNDVAIVDRLRYNILLASMFVVFLALAIFFRLISHLLDFL
jgi:hypothetical protein